MQTTSTTDTMQVSSTHISNTAEQKITESSEQHVTEQENYLGKTLSHLKNKHYDKIRIFIIL